MTPAPETYVPPHICRVIEGLYKLEHEVAHDAAALIAAMVGQLVPDNLAVCLMSNTATRGGVSVKLTPTQAVLLHELVNTYKPGMPWESIVSIQKMYIAIYGAKATKSMNVIRVMMCDLRKKLKPLKVDVQNQNGHGYRLALAHYPKR